MHVELLLEDVEGPAQPSQFSALHAVGDFFLKSYGEWWWQLADDEHPLELLGGVSDDDTVVEVARTEDDAVEADVVFGIVGLLLLELVGLEVSGFVDELATDGPGAVPTFGAGIFWQFGGS